MAMDRKACRVANAAATCQGDYLSLTPSSVRPLCPTRPYKLLWQMRCQGLRQALRITLLRIRRAITRHPARRSAQQSKASVLDVLDLKPGEQVRVRTEPEILATLDKCDQYKGMAWMPMMRDCCGREFKVYKRVNKIVLESTGEIRKLKNTVLLESAICDGIYGCDRSCFFFWKEAWLQRVARCAADE